VRACERTRTGLVVLLPELADGAKVLAELHAAVHALVGHRLDCVAKLADDRLRRKTIDFVVRDGVVVAEPTFEWAVGTALGNDHTLAVVMVAQGGE
jgi:hypothetical protein